MFHFQLLWTLAALSPVLCRIYIHANSTILDDYEIDDIFYPAYVFPIVGDLYDVGEMCTDIDAKFTPTDRYVVHFILLQQSPNCTPYVQVSEALKRKYRYIIIAADWSAIKPVEKMLQNEADQLSAIIIVVSRKIGLLLSRYDYKTGSLLYVTWDEFNRFLVMIMPLMIIGCVTGLILLITGVVLLTKCLLRYIRRYRDRTRILRLPSKKCSAVVLDENCPICFEEYAIGEIVTYLSCGHGELVIDPEYHQICLSLWAGSECPLCRGPMFENKNSTPNRFLSFFTRSGRYSRIPENDSSASNLSLSNHNILNINQPIELTQSNTESTSIEVIVSQPSPAMESSHQSPDNNPIQKSVQVIVPQSNPPTVITPDQTPDDNIKNTNEGIIMPQSNPPISEVPEQEPDNNPKATTVEVIISPSNPPDMENPDQSHDNQNILV
ncbi:hypothetical protein RF11_05260 [Thelohanellus kitauei]|uniref:RING-type domain-containing protein n=1 Tax=Thelohanellus kitauei TaxID=669202 RepID=A0A0C2N4R8_THEKT|nr:hypothetical protein RF11_05260 [Thelohanellus kitauei]